MPLQENSRLISVVDRLMMLISLTVAIVLPLGFSGLAFTHLVASVETDARVKAAAITDLVSANPGFWAYETLRIEDLLARYPVLMGGEAAIAYDAKGVLLARAGDPPDPPVLRRSYPLYDSGSVVGRIEVESSLRDLIFGTALAALLGGILGAAVYGLFRLWPLRILRRMGDTLQAKQTALWESERRYRTLIEWSPEAMIVYRGRRVLYVNPAAIKLFGQSTAEEMASKTILDFIHPDSHQLALARVQGIAEGGASPPMAEMKFIKLDGTAIDGEIQSTSIVFDGKPAVCSIIRDVTERRQAAVARVSLEAQLRESQKMEAIGTLAGGIAHDFNNILATILGNTELARQDVSSNPLALESLEEIRKAGSRARDLVQQILSFSRRQPTERRLTALAPIVDESARLLRALLPARVALDVHCDAGTPPVRADASQIQQILVNLVTNAMQAMPVGPGRIGIRLDTIMLDGALMETHPELRALHEKHPGRTVRLAVSDDGAGMDAATLARIFEPFFTTKPVDEGTGLGLAVVHGIVKTHEGEIVVASETGKGTTFTIYLPDEGPTEARGSDDRLAAIAAAPDVATGRHILYLDDDESLVFLVRRLLERRGMVISAYTDQRAALDALRADPASFDLVVTDYNMPGMSGLDLAREVRTIRADLPVAVASGFIDEALRAQAAGAGVRELVFKANAVEGLCEAVARLAQTTQRNK